MAIPKLSDFLSDPKHKEERDFMQGVIDARFKEIEEQYRQKKKGKGKNKDDDDNDDDDNASSGSIWDDLFGGKK